MSKLIKKFPIDKLLCMDKERIKFSEEALIRKIKRHNMSLAKIAEAEMKRQRLLLGGMAELKFPSFVSDGKRRKPGR